MNKIVFITVLTIVILSSSAAFASAVLVDSKGAVTVTAPGKGATPAKLGLELQDGAIVKTSADGEASLMFETGAVEKIKGNNTYTVGQKQQAGERTNLGSGIALAMRELKGGGQGPTVHGMVKEVKTVKIGALSLGGINALYPFNTSIRLGDSVKFTWGPAPPVNWPKPVIIISDEGKRNLLVKSISPGATNIEIKPVEARLAKGRSYTWFLASNEGGIRAKSNRFGFKTLSADSERLVGSDISKIRSLDMSSDGKDLLVSQVLYTFKLYDEMVALLEGLSKSNPTPFIQNMLNFGKAQMGRK